MQLSSLTLYNSNTISFEVLKQLGWVHPLGLHNDPLERSLVKSYHNLQFQIVLHIPVDHYAGLRCEETECGWYGVFVHDKRDPAIVRKSEGLPFSTTDIIEALVWFESELELASSAGVEHAQNNP